MRHYRDIETAGRTMAVSMVLSYVIPAVAILALVLVVQCTARQDLVNAARIEQAEQNGVRVSRIARERRATAERAVAAMHAASAQRRTVAVRTDTGLAQLRRSTDSLVAIPNDTITGATLVGLPIPPMDSVVTVGFARQLVNDVIDSARVLILNERAAAHLELARAEVAVINLQSALAAQDSVIANDRVLVASLKRQRRGFWRRALDGVTTVGAGAVCGGVGLIGGPLFAVGAAGACIVVVEVAR